MKKYFLVATLILYPIIADARPASTYKDRSGAYHTLNMVSGVKADGTPIVSAYKDAAGIWRSTQVIENICGLDSNDAPVVCNTLSSAMVNLANGIAGLDSLGNITAPVNAPLLTGAPSTSVGAQPLVNLGRFPIMNAVANEADPFQSPDALYVGGLPTQGWAANGLANNERGRPGSLVVVGQPWGPYNAGTLESLLWGMGVDQQNGVANVDWRTGSVPPFDAVAQYIGVTNTQAMIVAPARFGSGNVTISPALNATQIAQLRVGMYISTNVTNSQVSMKGPSNWIGSSYPIANYYQGIISGWHQDTDSSGHSVTIITVPAWDSYDFTAHSMTAVPGQQSGDAIDTVRSDYRTPMVFIGNDTGEAAHNEYIFYDGSKSATPSNGGHATALSHALGDDEVDLRYYATQPNEVYVTGLTLSLAAMANSPVGREAITSGSYLLNLSSGDAPNLLVLDGAAEANIVQGHSFYLHGQEGTFFPKGSTSVRPVQTNFSFMSYADSTNAMNLISYQQAYGTGMGYANTSYHFGLHTDGDVMKPTTSGYNQGEIEWNPKGTAQGSIGLCANGENCGVLVGGNGVASVPNGLNFPSPSSNGVSTYATEDDGANLTFHASNGPGSYANLKAATFTATAAIIAPSIVTQSGVGPADPGITMANLPSGRLSDGQRAWCSDCISNGIMGVEAFWHASAGKWTDQANVTLTTAHR